MNSKKALFAGLLLPALLAASALAETPAGATRQVPVDANMHIGVDWFDGSGCAMQPSDNFYFQVGEANFRMPPQNIISGGTNTSQVEGSREKGLFMNLPLSSGCKSDPLKFVSLFLKTKKGVPVLIMQRPNNDQIIIDHLKSLGKRGDCIKPRNKNFAICSCIFAVGQEKMPLIFVTPFSELGKPVVSSRGDPIFATCKRAGDGRKIDVCYIDVIFRGNVKARLPISISDVSKVTILGGHDEVEAFVSTLRVE